MNYKLKISLLFIFGFILLTPNVYADKSTQWMSVGKEESFSTKSVGYFSIKLDFNDTPYVSYFDSRDKKIFVRKFNGTEWEILGGKEVSEVDIKALSLAIDKNNIPYIAFDDSKNYTISVLKYTNGVWEKINLEGLSKLESGYPFITFDKNNILSISYLHADPDGNSSTGVSKYYGTKWIDVSSTPMNMLLACLSMNFDNNNKPYLSCFTKIGKKSVVVRYNGTDWEKVGNIPGVWNEEKNNIVFDKNNNPYFSYLDGEYRNNLHIIKFNGKEWEEVGKMNFPGYYIWNSILAIDKNDMLYVAYPDVGMMDVKVIKFNGTEWKKLEDVGANSGLISFDIDSKNIPYILYYKGYINLGKDEETITIQKFIDSSSIKTYNLGTVTLKNGSRGEAVMELQRFLNDTLNMGLVVDGKLGPKTIIVIKNWQKEHGLVPDGLIGTKTKAIMNNNKEVKKEINNPSPSSQVPKGTFRNTETGYVFSYVDNWGYLASCNPNCKSVYFDIDSNGNILQIREVKENPIIGRIDSFTIDKDNPEIVNYVVEYKYGNKINKSTYTTQLCDYFQGGGKQCRAPVIKDTPIIINLKEDDNSVVENIIIFNKILKADLLDIVNVDHI